MRLTAFILLAACLSVSARSFSQITLYEKNTPLISVFKELQRQSGYDFFYPYELLAQQDNVSVSLENASLQDAIRAVLKDRPLTYQIFDKTVVIKPLKEVAPVTAATQENHTIRGRLVDEEGEPVIASVQVKGTQNGTNTNASGEFTLEDVDENATLVISATNIETMEVKLKGRKVLLLKVKKKVSALDQQVVIAYGTTTKRLNTGNVTTVTSEDLSNQPVFSIAQALEGRVPGMTVSQVSGVPGARMPVQIRGRSNFDSDVSSDQPLFIIDGVPMAANNDAINLLSDPFGPSTTDGLSALAGINPADVASIDILKDADATAIYGSRGANGVILITTKHGKTGKTSISANVTMGANKASQLPHMLNTQQYLTMRNEALANDNLTKTTSNAYDLLLWDTTRYTDFAKLLIGHTAQVMDAQVSASGGDQNIQYRLSGTYHKEGVVWIGDKTADRAAFSFNLHSRSQNKKLDINFTSNYARNNSNLAAGDLSSAIVLPPNFQVYDSAGNLAWNEGGVYVNRDNPLAMLNVEYHSLMSNLNSNLALSYKILDNLSLKASMGYNITGNDEKRVTPLESINPSNSRTGQLSFGHNELRSWIFEPQAEYNTLINRGKLDVLVGGTFSKKETQGESIVANGFTSDQLINTLSAVSSSDISASNKGSQYAYEAFFGRINYNWENKYILNLTGRRDGSSRFGPELRFSNFGAVGAAWLFTNESWMKNNHIFSYGKLRGSYGSTGNDQIGDYNYLDSWEAGGTYYDSSTIYPERLFNPYLHWEKTNKAEIALELGFLNDRILFTSAFYRNIVTEPLVTYPLSGVTGFSSIVTNLDGVEVENKGVELTLQSQNINTHDFKWTSNLNLTIPRNQLKKYPNLEESSYSSKYAIGEPLNIIIGYQWKGVDPDTGDPTVVDQDGDGKASTANDFVHNGTTDQRFYGGFNNTFSYKGFTASIFFQFVKQTGRNWLNSLVLNPAGRYYNVPDLAMERWQEKGDITEVPKFTTSAGSFTGLSGFYAMYFSNHLYTDASFIRLKNVALSYDFDGNCLNKMHLQSLRVFVQGQNLLTFTGYKGADPETQSFTRLPTMRSFLAGIQLSL